jgi:SAM-dependent methyltransferase
MTAAIQVFERPTHETLNAYGYLIANSDLRKVFGDDQAAACQHFHEYGHQENSRLQLTTAFLSSQREKFSRFKETLYDCNAESFPVQFGASLHKLAEYDAESANGLPSPWIAELDGNPNKLFGDIGAGLRSTVWLNCVNVEVYPSITSDILIEPNCELPFRDASLDGIGCFAVLEHVNKPWEMAREFARVVKPGGKIFIDWPFLQPVHGYPSHYYNATREGLCALFSGEFEISELYTHAWQGPDFTVSWILNALVSSIKDDDLRKRLSEMTVGDLCKQPCSPLAQGEWWRTILSELDDRDISILSCGNTLIATRKHAGRAFRPEQS